MLLPFRAPEDPRTATGLHQTISYVSSANKEKPSTSLAIFIMMAISCFQALSQDFVGDRKRATMEHPPSANTNFFWWEIRVHGDYIPLEVVLIGVGQ